MQQITEKERFYLRELAKKQLEYAHLPEMEAKKQKWYDLNMGRKVEPPVVVESWTFEQDIMPESIYQCTNPQARKVEQELLRNIREYELIGDDKVMQDYFPVELKLQVDEFGVSVEERHAVGSDNRSIGLEYKSPIQDLEEDFYILKPSTVEICQQESEENKVFAEEILGDIMPVKLETYLPIISMPFQMSKLLGLEGMMMSLYDCPETVHRLMEYLTDNQIQVMKTCEEAGILTMNKENHGDYMHHGLGVSSYTFTEELTKSSKGKVQLKDLWIWAEAEETAAISAEQFREFFLPYMAKAAQEMGLIYYGCCEPMERVLEDVLRSIPNIRKVSVSPWSDQKKVGEILSGTGIVFSRKPFANYLSIDKQFDEEAWSAHIKETLVAARGCPCEILMRDIYQVTDLKNVRRAVEIVRELAQDYV